LPDTGADALTIGAWGVALAAIGVIMLLVIASRTPDEGDKPW
jgi:hypothetical protein